MPMTENALAQLGLTPDQVGRLRGSCMKEQVSHAMAHSAHL